MSGSTRLDSITRRNTLAAAALWTVSTFASVGAHAAITPSPTYSNNFEAGSTNPFTRSTNVDSTSGISGGKYVLKSASGSNVPFSATTDVTNLGGSQQNSFAISTTVNLASSRSDVTDTAGFALFADNSNSIQNMYLVDLSNAAGTDGATFRIIEVRSTANGGNGVPVEQKFTFSSATTYRIDVTGTYTTPSRLDLTATLRDAASPQTVLETINFADTTGLQTGQFFGFRGRVGTGTNHVVTATYDNFSLTVPEPASVAMLAACTAAMLLRRKRRRA